MTPLIFALVYIIAAIVWNVIQDERGLTEGPAALMLAGLACIVAAGLVAVAPSLVALVP